MALRVNHKMVEDVLQECYDTSTKLDRYIRAANLFTDRVETCAIDKGLDLTAAELREIEAWMAAHFYTKMDPVYQSRSTNGASGAFVRDPKVPEPFLSGAMAIDYSGCVAALIEKKRASAVWMGRPPSEQTPYVDRD